MQPTHENIDRWLFDYTEGNLSAEQEQQLELFLMNHPDIETDMDAWEMSKVDVAPMVFQHKELLYKKRSYKPALALLSLLILFTTGISLFYSNQQKETHKQSMNAQSGKKQTERTHQKIANPTIKRTESDQSISSFNGPSLSTPQLTVSFPYEATRKTTDHLSLNASTGQGSLSRVEVTNESSHSVTEKASDLKLSNSNVPISTMEFERINLHTLKGMIVGGYRTDFKNEELSLHAELDAAVICLGNINLFKKIDQLLSKDIGLSNNQSYDYTMPGQSNLDLNFSSVGTTSQTRFQAVSSMRSLENPTQFRLNNQLSLDAYSRNMRAGFGIQANYDDFSTGLIRNGNVALIFSPKIALSRKISLEPAVRFKMGTHTLNEQKMVNESSVEYNTGQVNQFQFDPNLAIGRTLWYRDLDAGLTIHTPIFFLSGQISNLFQHNENIFSNNGETLAASRNVNLITGTQYISRNEKLIFAPYAIYQHSNYQKQLFGGFTFKAGKAQLGLSYGNLNTGSVSLGYVGKNLSVIGQSGFGTLESTQQRTYTHQLTLRIHSSVSKKARRYISL
ncbi:MAG: hypothetical protein KA736_00105 [Crocinitomicaceae bacterium]|nr:hypothetical protein [Crocinitomicaceae bacterium]MBP6032950.1 hypothetical protein [Crocinitomicaceae bacterium]